MLTAAGSGYSRWRDIALTRWREDPTCDPWGFYVFLRDVFNGHVWSAGYQPIGRRIRKLRGGFLRGSRGDPPQGRADPHRHADHRVCARTMRKCAALSLTNEGSGVREIELTIVLGSGFESTRRPIPRIRHFRRCSCRPNLSPSAARCWRRGGSAIPAKPRCGWCISASLDGEAVGGLQFETDRARFLGRGHDVRNAASIMDARGRCPTPWAPCSTRCWRCGAACGSIRAKPSHVAFWTGIAASRAQALELVDKLGERSGFSAHAKRCREPSAETQLRDLDINSEDAELFQELAERMLYSDASLRAAGRILDAISLGQSALWTHGVSGDLPIVLALHQATEADIEPSSSNCCARRATGRSSAWRRIWSF